MSDWMTTTEIAENLGINTSKVRQWIMREELRAVNIANYDTHSRPRYRIKKDWLDDFLSGREYHPPVSAAAQNRSKVKKKYLL